MDGDADPSPQDSVEFRINAPYHDMLEMLGRSSIGLSTMVDEHFGINVVEYMVSTKYLYTSVLVFDQMSAGRWRCPTRARVCRAAARHCHTMGRTADRYVLVLLKSHSYK